MAGVAPQPQRQVPNDALVPGRQVGVAACRISGTACILSSTFGKQCAQRQPRLSMRGECHATGTHHPAAGPCRLTCQSPPPRCQRRSLAQPTTARSRHRHALIRSRGRRPRRRVPAGGGGGGGKWDDPAASCTPCTETCTHPLQLAAPLIGTGPGCTRLQVSCQAQRAAAQRVRLGAWPQRCSGRGADCQTQQQARQQPGPGLAACRASRHCWGLRVSTVERPNGDDQRQSRRRCLPGAGAPAVQWQQAAAGGMNSGSALQVCSAQLVAVVMQAIRAAASLTGELPCSAALLQWRPASEQPVGRLPLPPAACRIWFDQLCS